MTPRQEPLKPSHLQQSAESKRQQFSQSGVEGKLRGFNEQRLLIMAGGIMKKGRGMLCLAEETKELFVIAAEPGIRKLTYKII